MHSRLISSHIIARMSIRNGRKFAFQNKEERKAFYFILFLSNLFYGVRMLEGYSEKFIKCNIILPLKLFLTIDRIDRVNFRIMNVLITHSIH